MRSCDGLYENGSRMNGAYNLTIQGARIQVYCEFQVNSYNWLVNQGLVSKQRKLVSNQSFAFRSFKGGKTDFSISIRIGLNTKEDSEI